MAKDPKLPIFILLIGSLFCSSAVVMIKASKIDPNLLAAHRLLVAGLLLLPLYIKALKKSGTKVKDTLYACVPGILLSLHFITWVSGCRATYAANAALIVNMVPAVMPVILFLMIREVLTKKEVLGSLFAVSGIFILMLSDFKYNSAHFRGDLICFGSMILFAIYLVMSRKNRGKGSIWLYTVPLYLSASLSCFLIALCRGVLPWDGLNLTEGGHIIMLAIFPTIIGHTALNYSMKVLRGQVVGVLNLTQFIFAAVFGYLFFTEIPEKAFYIAVLMLITGIFIIISKRSQTQSSAQD